VSSIAFACAAVVPANADPFGCLGIMNLRDVPNNGSHNGSHSQLAYAYSAALRVCVKKDQRARIPILIMLVSLFTTILVSCSSTTNYQRSNVPAPDSEQILRLPIGQSDFTTLDPALVQDGGDVEAIQTLFTGLVQFNDRGLVKDQLAASHAISSDGLTYTFTLRPNLKFSDGTPLTAQDVAYSINRTLSPATQSPVTNYLSLIKDYDKMVSGRLPTLIGDSLIVKDAQTFVIVLQQPAVYFLQTLTYPTSYVVERKLIERYGKDWTDHLTSGGGDGPFKVTSYSHTLGLEVVPNQFYYGHHPRLQRIAFAISGDTNTTYQAYLSNQYDQTGIPTVKLDYAKTRSDYVHAPALLLTVVQLNYMVKPFNVLKIRQAFDVALNRNLISEHLLRGVVTPTHRYIPAGMYGANPQEVVGPDGATFTSGNRAKALELLQQGLQEGGYKSIRDLPPIILSTTNRLSSLKLANVLANEWENILGVAVRINPIDPNLYDQAYGAGNLQTWIYAWQADYPDPHDWLAVFFGKGESYNNTHYGQNNSSMAQEQQATQKAIIRADTLTNLDERARTYHDIEQKLANETAWIPLYQSSYNYLQNPGVHGMVDNPLGIIDPEDWNTIYITI
jgi:oligopeptide transport system substrate-binding protein